MHAESVFELAEMDDKSRREALSGLTSKQLRDVAAVCNAFPNIDILFEVATPSPVEPGSAVTVRVSLSRATDDVEQSKGGPAARPVHAPYFPREKFEEWWVIVGEQKKNQLVSNKRIALTKAHKLNLEFAAPSEPGRHTFTLMVMSDSYVGADQEFSFDLDVKEASPQPQPMDTTTS
jgi:pre-mRNA-splicing helicase BRR2